MDDRALTLAIRLLTAAIVSMEVVALDGCCGLGYDPWEETRDIDLGVDADLLAITLYPIPLTYVAVGTDGAVVAWNPSFDDTEPEIISVSTAVAADLRAVWAAPSSWWVAGDGGALAYSLDEGETWTRVDLGGLDADLWAIASVGSRLVVVGDEVVLVQDLDGVWAEVPAPAGGWGQLRAVYEDSERIYAVGLGGVIWSAVDPSGEWVAEDSGVDEDLFDVGYIPEHGLVAVGSAGTMLARDAGWARVDSGTNVDLVALEPDGVLGAGGEVFYLGSKGTLGLVETVPGARALSFVLRSDVVTVGDDGAVTSKEFVYCVGGRPFAVDGRPNTATLVRGVGHGDPGSALAEAWTEDGLFEHASVASFARHTLELLALGAPAWLIRATQAAAADELVHARICFDLARRSVGAAIEPGPLAMPSSAFTRLGDPVATALALFEEGCINESVAACEAAEALARCRDPRARAALEVIAADERRHAALAWAGLRWLIEAYGEAVREPLRRRLERLRTTAVDNADTEPPDEAHGRLSTARRVWIHHRVTTELIRPLGRMLCAREVG